MDGYDEQPAGLCIFLCGAAECLSYTEGEALAGCVELWQPVGAFFMAAERVTGALERLRQDEGSGPVREEGE